MSTVWETYEGVHLETRFERELRPVKCGKAGWIVRGGGVCSGPLPMALRVLASFTSGERSRSIRKWAAISGIAGSLLTRWGWILAGHTSARDWRLPLEIAEPKSAESQPFCEEIAAPFPAAKLG